MGLWNARNGSMVRHLSNNRSITDILFPEMSAEARLRVERFRQTWVERNGPIDLTKYYTSRWPRSEQLALIELDFNAYLSGLPAFFQNMLHDMITDASLRGEMADLPKQYVEQFMGSSRRR